MERVDRPIARKLAPLGVVARIAGSQHGVVARWQLLRAGLTRDQVDHLLGRPRVARVTEEQLTLQRGETAGRITALLRQAA